MARRKYPVTENEGREQAYLFEWAALMSREHPELKWLYHIPNGGSRNAAEAANLKRQGVKPGVPDLCLPVGRGGFLGLYIELKAHSNKPTQLQNEWLAALGEYGYKAVVCHGWKQAAAVILQFLKGKEISSKLREGE